MESTRLWLLVRGTVQGVGFRPYVYRLATELGLAGSVANTKDGVVIEVEGPEAAVNAFRQRLPKEAPDLARVEQVHETPLAPVHEEGFKILDSAQGGAATTIIPPDVATCEACLRELFDPSDRRYRYPFINCTDCGPRFSIIEGVPYDRGRTTMRVFKMCEQCEAEYKDPRTRRFHAEPNACQRCGPRPGLLDGQGRPIEAPDPIAEAGRLLAQGHIVAVKGLGGFHLAADARNEGTVTRLRRLKQRDSKPFAIMVLEEGHLAGVASPSPEELDLLRSRARPIVLLRKAEPFTLASDVSPGNATVGVMLPYTPLHHLLLQASPPVLVMTSANPCDEPICRANEEAIQRLSGIADAFLVHDRDILARTDDSVYAYFAGGPRPIRRSRGYVPTPIHLAVSGSPVLAVGGDLKNVFCITRGAEAFLGPHVGDLANAATAQYFLEAVEHLCSLLAVSFTSVVHDLHPDYVSTRLAERIAQEKGLPLIPVQHHHGHILACLAENRHLGPAIGLAMDGTGFGTDGTSWGGEVLLVHGKAFERLAHLATLPLPGGDAAAREPWRIAVAALAEAGQTRLAAQLAALWPHARPDIFRAILRLAAQGRMHRSSSLGRLFDAASAILGLRDLATYEGEAAVALEHAAWQAPLPAAAPCPIEQRSEGPAIIPTRDLLVRLAEAVLGGEGAQALAASFHASVIETLAHAALWAAESTGVRTVALSGGSFQNRLLTEGLIARLEARGLCVLTHTLVPTNDAGIALGQAMAAI